MKKVRTRFAPSPTGHMHIGNLRTCLYAYLFSKQNDGTFILRIEDTDQNRYLQGAIETIYSTLQIANIIPDEGPYSGGEFGPYIQSERKQIYQKYAKELIDKKEAYYCFCDKERLASLKDEKGIGKYDKHCLHLSKEEIDEKLKNKTPYVIRQNIPLEGVSEYDDMVFGHIKINNSDMEDNVLLKSDGMPTYNFANVVDDHLMQITHVMRGIEYLSSTPKYNLLYDAFGWERPFYIHMPPIMKNEKQKLSKRYGDANFEDFINKGYLPEAIVNYIALLGWSPKTMQEKMTMQEMIDLFSIDGISKSGSIFDEVKMAWLNSEYIKAMDIEEFIKRSKKYYEQSSVSSVYDYKIIAPLLKTRIDKFSDIKEKIDFLDKFAKYPVEWFENKKNKVDKKMALEILEATLKAFNGIDDWTEDNMKEEIASIAKVNGYKNGQIFLTIRLAVTGVQTSPGGATEMANILGKEETLKRLEFSVKLLKEEGGVK